jgi:hypothetical protein
MQGSDESPVAIGTEDTVDAWMQTGLRVVPACQGMNFSGWEGREEVSELEVYDW